MKTLTKILTCLLLCIQMSSLRAATTLLSADGKTETYTLINQTLGAPAETPDCGHQDFGPHITQEYDTELNKPVFVFYMHATHDNDRCITSDRQRVEIKTYNSSPAHTKGFQGDTVTYRWKFKLAADFKPSTYFTHIHEIKAGDGDTSKPIITVTLRDKGNERLQIIHNASNGTENILAEIDLVPLKGVWVEAYEKITYDNHGSYSIILTTANGKSFSYKNTYLDMWRSGTTFVRPKWGIYRSLLNKSSLRDEAIRFNDFCLAKGNTECSPPK